MSSQMPSASPIEGANFERWKESGEPEKQAWRHRKSGWNDEDWRNFLRELGESQYWPMNEAAVRRRIEMLRDEIRRLPNFSSDPTRALLDAARDGKSDVVKWLLFTNADVNAKSHVDTPLCCAAREGHTEVVKLLLASKADVDARWMYCDDTPLAAAVYWGRTEAVRLLLAAGAKVDIEVRSGGGLGETPLLRAARHGYVEIVRLLLAAGASVDKRVWRGYPGATPLHEAAQNGRTEVVKLLLEAGADTNAEHHDVGTPWWGAIMCGHRDVVELFLAAKADVNARCKGYDLNWHIYGKTPLYTAVSQGHWNVAGLLVRHGARMTLPEIPVALWKNLPRLWDSLVGLVDLCAKHWIPAVTVLTAVVLAGFAAILRRLSPAFPIWGTCVAGLASALAVVFCLRAVNEKDDDLIPAYRARLLVAWGMFAVLIAAGLHELFPWFAVWVAAALFGALAGPIACPLALLLPEPLPPRKKINDKRIGSTALMKAAEEGKLWRVKALIARGADVNIQADYRRRTALMYAAEKGSAGCVKALLAAGADVDVKDHIGETVLDQCRYKSDIAAILKAPPPSPPAPAPERTSDGPSLWTKGRQNPKSCAVTRIGSGDSRGLRFLCPACSSPNTVLDSALTTPFGARVRCHCGCFSHAPSTVKTKADVRGIAIHGAVRVSIADFPHWLAGHPSHRTSNSEVYANYGLWATCAGCGYEYETTVTAMPFVWATPAKTTIMGVNSEKSGREFRALAQKQCPSCGDPDLYALLVDVPKEIADFVRAEMKRHYAGG